MPDTFVRASTGEMFILNGIDRVISWDGIKPQASISQIETPASKVTLSVASTGQISGLYYAYCRFISEDGTPSNLSPLSNLLSVSSKTGEITNVSQTTPLVVESMAHGLADGQYVTVSGVGGVTTANGNFQIEIIDQDFFTLVGSTASGLYTGGGSWLAGVGKVVYSNVPVPTDQKIVKRQLLRNTHGQTEVFFVDIETENLTGKAFFSDKTDEQLVEQEAVPLYDSDLSPVANGFPEIPNHKPYGATISDRLFIAGAKSYTQGSAKVENGNAYVYGIGTDWKNTFVGRKFFCSGSSKVSDIIEVNEGLQRITLKSPYIGRTSFYDSYTISPSYLEKRALYFSEVGEPKKMLTTSGIVVQEDQDEIRGLINLETFLYIFFKNKIYRLTFGNSPDTDGAVYPCSYTRGALNQKCIIAKGSAMLAMDRLGIYAFSSNEEQSLSTPISSLFSNQNPYYSINWKYSDNFHAVHVSSQNTIRWFVVMGAGRYPRHALCFNYETKCWWIEEFSSPVFSSCQDFDPASVTCFLGMNNNRVVRYPQGSLDGVEQSKSATNGAVSAYSTHWLEDSSMQFDSTVVVNNPILIRIPSGETFSRVVKKAVGSRLYFDRPIIKKYEGATYHLGSVTWTFRTGNFRIDGNDKNMVRKIEFIFQPSKTENKFNAKIYRDREDVPIKFKKPFRKETDQEFGVSDDGSMLVGNFTKQNGCLSQRIDTHREYAIDGVRYISLEVEGATSMSPLSIYGVRLEGVFHAPSVGPGQGSSDA
jgi:hypothetical protein